MDMSAWHDATEPEISYYLFPKFLFLLAQTWHLLHFPQCKLTTTNNRAFKLQLPKCYQTPHQHIFSFSDFKWINADFTQLLWRHFLSYFFPHMKLLAQVHQWSSDFTELCVQTFISSNDHLSSRIFKPPYHLCLSLLSLQSHSFTTPPSHHPAVTTIKAPIYCFLRGSTVGCYLQVSTSKWRSKAEVFSQIRSFCSLTSGLLHSTFDLKNQILL